MMKATVLNQAGYYALGIIMMKGVSLLMIPYVTRQLTPVEYGTLEILILFADVSTIIIGFGLVEALNRFVGLAKKEHSSRLISNCFSLSVVVALLAMLLIVIFSADILHHLPAELTLTQLLLISFPVMLEGLIAIPLTLMRMQSLAKRFCYLNVAKAIVQAVLVVILLQLDYGINAILFAAAVSSFMLVVLLMPYQWQQMAKHWQWQESMAILRYGIPIVAGRLGLFAMTGLDRWLLADKVGIESLAVYAIAVKFALILGLLMQPFGLWWFPYRFTLLKQADGKSQCAHFAMLGTNLGFVIGFLMMLTVPAFMQLILPTSYHDAAFIVIALLAVNMIKNAGDLLNLGCFVNSSISQMWVQWLCAVCAVVGYLYFIEDYGVWAAAGVLFAVYLLRLVLFLGYSQKVLHLPYRYQQVLMVIGLGALLMFALQPLMVSGVSVLMPELLIWGQFIAGLLLSLLYLLLLITLRVIPNPIEWRQQRADKSNNKPDNKAIML